MRAPPKTTTIYTTAPSVYDWWFTSEISAHVGTTTNGKMVRKVEVEIDRVEEQCDRYASGLHTVADETEWKKLVEYGLVTVA